MTQTKTRPIRLHVAIGVTSLAKSRSFYSEFFRSEPTRVTADQIDWMLDCPAVNFSIFYNPDRPIGPEHVGLDFPANMLGPEIERLKVKDFAISDPDGIRVEVFSSDKAKQVT